jgi:hypothetical protein
MEGVGGLMLEECSVVLQRRRQVWDGAGEDSQVLATVSL